MRADEVGHVLDHPDDLEVGLHGHLAGPLGDLAGGLLGRGDHQHLRAGQEPGHRDGHVPGAGRQVRQQEVQLSPVHVAEELLDGLVQHGPSPDHRLLLGDEEPHGDDPHAVRFQRQDHVVEADGAPGHTHHARNGEPPDVHVDDADPVPLGGEGRGQVDRDGGLADAALPGGHGDHRRVAFGEERPLLHRGGPAAQLRHELFALVLVHLTEDHLDALAGIEDRANRGPDIGVDAILQRATRDGQQDIDADDSVVDLDALEHPDVLDRLSDLWVEDVSEGLANLFLGGHGVLRIMLIRTVLTSIIRRWAGSSLVPGYPTMAACRTSERSMCTRRWPTIPGFASTVTSGWPGGRCPFGRCPGACPCIPIRFGRTCAG